MYRVGIDARLALFDSAGIGAYIRNLAAALTELLGKDSVRPLTDFRDETWGRSSVRVIGPAHSLAGDRIFSWQLSAARLDVLHAPDHVLPPRVSAPTVVTVHDLSFVAEPATHDKKSLRYYSRFRGSVERADAVICVSDFTRDELLRETDVDAGKVEVIPSGLPSNFARNVDSSVRRSPKDYGLEGRYALFLGTLGLRKNVVRLIEGFIKAPNSGRLTLALAGRPGNGYDEIREVIDRRRLRDRVRLLGSPATPDLPALMAGAEFLVLTSLYEGFGFPVLEAMACGVACLVSKGPPLADLAGPAGIAVDPLLVDDIAAGVERLIADGDLRRRLAAAGPARAAEYTWDRTAKRTAAVYEKVLR